jgi:hypothetical protein
MLAPHSFPSSGSNYALSSCLLALFSTTWQSSRPGLSLQILLQPHAVHTPQGKVLGYWPDATEPSWLAMAGLIPCASLAWGLLGPAWSIPRCIAPGSRCQLLAGSSACTYHNTLHQTTDQAGNTSLNFCLDVCGCFTWYWQMIEDAFKGRYMQSHAKKVGFEACRFVCLLRTNAQLCISYQQRCAHTGSMTCVGNIIIVESWDTTSLQNTHREHRIGKVDELFIDCLWVQIKSDEQHGPRWDSICSASELPTYHGAIWLHICSNPNQLNWIRPYDQLVAQWRQVVPLPSSWLTKFDSLCGKEMSHEHRHLSIMIPQ